MNSNWICQRCGSVMNMKIGYGYCVYYECPNGCKPINYTYSSSSTNASEKIDFKQVDGNHSYC